MARISSKHQVTLSVESRRQAGIHVGDEVEADATHRVCSRAVGVFDGLYEPDYLERLRTGERA